MNEHVRSLPSLLSVPFNATSRVIVARAMFLLLIVLNLATDVAAQSHSYRVHRLVIEPPIYGFSAETLSEDGRVGGYIGVNLSQLPFDAAVVWDHAGQPSALPVPYKYSQAGVLGFRPNGTPVGIVLAANASVGRAGMWNSDGFTALPNLGEGGAAFSGSADRVCGVSYGFPQGGRATVWDATGAHLITGLDGLDSIAWNINAGGTYVGHGVDRSTSPPTARSFVGQNGSATLLDYPGFNTFRAFDINDDGWIAGLWNTGTNLTRHAYVARGDEIMDLGFLPGAEGMSATSINNDRTVAGYSLRGGSRDKAVIWPNGSVDPIDLNLVTDLPPDTRLVEARDINDAGQILAVGNNSYYVLTPIVPEPASVASIGTGLLVLMGRRRQGR